MRVPQSHLAPQRLDTGHTPAVSAVQRWRAVGLELVRNSRQRPTRRRQFLDTGTEMGVIAPVGVAGNGPYQHTVRLAASRPGHADPDLLARTLRLHLYPLDHLADDFFAVRIRGGRSAPQCRNVGSELANRVAFLCWSGRAAAAGGSGDTLPRGSAALAISPPRLAPASGQPTGSPVRPSGTVWPHAPSRRRRALDAAPTAAPRRPGPVRPARPRPGTTRVPRARARQSTCVVTKSSRLGPATCWQSASP